MEYRTEMFRVNDEPVVRTPYPPRAERKFTNEIQRPLMDVPPSMRTAPYVTAPPKYAEQFVNEKVTLLTKLGAFT